MQRQPIPFDASLVPEHVAASASADAPLDIRDATVNACVQIAAGKRVYGRTHAPRFAYAQFMKAVITAELADVEVGDIIGLFAACETHIDASGLWSAWSLTGAQRLGVTVDAPPTHDELAAASVAYMAAHATKEPVHQCAPLSCLWCSCDVQSVIMS